MPANGFFERHCRVVAGRMAEGKVIPFLGAGANLCGRRPEADWQRERLLPSGRELADYLAEQYAYPPDEPRDLLRVSQYVDLATGGDAALFETLHELFAHDFEPNPVHRFFAERAATARAGGLPVPCPLIVTTNYDDALERAFAAAGEPIDVVFYAAETDEPGRFVHVSADGQRRAIPRNTD